MASERQRGAVDANSGVYVALLRGVNVGGKNRLPMKDLAALMGAAGCRDVRTYIQSGNAVFRATTAAARQLPAKLGAAITARFGFTTPVVLRTADELRAVAAANPYLAAGVEPRALHVAFLADEPEPARVAALDPARSPPDQFTVRGRDVYLHLPGGVARTKLTNAWFDSRLATVSTLRNWATVLELVALAQG